MAKRGQQKERMGETAHGITLDFYRYDDEHFASLTDVDQYRYLCNRLTTGADPLADLWDGIEIEDIFEEYEDDDTYEIYGEIGGDAVHYVIMKDDGAIYEK